MKNTFLKVAWIATLAAGLLSCNKDNDAASQPANEIIDAQGLKIQLSWSMNDGSTATTGANLDFHVYPGVGPSIGVPVIGGSSTTTFEVSDLLNTQPDGDYMLKIVYYDITKNGKFNLVFKGLSSDKNYSLNDNNFTIANDNAEFNFLRITKSGTKYTITKLDKGTVDSEITDSQGLNLQLNWSLSDGSSATAGADLDFRVFKGAGVDIVNIVPVYSFNSASFENADFLNSQPDGEYTLEIMYRNITKAGKFNLLLKGKAGNTTYSLNDNNFTDTSGYLRFDFIKITKAGTKYTVTKLF